MPVFGWDASDFDAPRGAEDMAAAHRDGIRFVTHKATEGVTVRHGHYGAVLTHARDAGIPVLGAYHVVRTGPPIDAQIAYLIATLDAATPWWRTHPNFFIQVDLEKWPQDPVPASVGCAFADHARHATGKYVVVYASAGQYGDSIPAGCDLWNARYPSSRSDHYSALYPGDNGVGWRNYSGRTPVIWQYTSSATIGSQPGCDANAFRGTLDQLLALTSTGDAMLAADIKTAWGPGLDEYLSAVERSVWDPALANSATAVAQLTAIQGSLAAIAAKVGAPVTVTMSDTQLQDLASAITSHPENPLGDADIPAIVKALRTYYAPAQAGP